MAEGLQRRVEAMLMTLAKTGSKAAAAGAFLYPSSMSWSGRQGGFLSIAPRNHPWRNIDPLDNSAVMNCLAWIFRNFGQGRLRTVKEQRDGSLKNVDVPGFLNLIYKPNPFHTAFSFWAGTMISYHLDGNAYWIKVRNARGFGVPTELWYEPHWSIRPHWPEDGSAFIDYYERRINGQIQKIPVENVVHFRNGLNPSNTRFGLAPLKVALLEVFTDQEAAAYTAALLKNMAIPGVVINPRTPIGLTPEKAEAIKQKWTQKFGGDNRGEPLLLDFEADVTTLGFSPNDMNFTEVRRIGEERISGCFGLPAIVAGLGAGLEASTYNNLKELKKSAFEDCLSPTWDYLAEEITNQLLRDFTDSADVMADFDLSQIAALKEDEDRKNARITDRVRGGIITVAQAQTDLGYVPDPAANYYLLPNNARPVTSAVAMARAQQEIEDPQSQPVTDEDGERQDAGKRLPLFNRKSKAVQWEGLELRREPTDLEKLVIKAVDQAMRDGARTIDTALLALRERLIEEAIEELANLDEGDYHSLVVQPTDEDRSELYALLAILFFIGAALIVDELNLQGAGITGGALTDSPDGVALQTLANVTASRVANDVQARVIASALAAVAFGQVVAERVRADMRDGSTAYVTRAANEAANASLAAGRGAEIKARREQVSFVVYSAVLDANTCEPCGETDGETGQIEDVTPVPNADCPGGAQCRCVLIPVVEGRDNA